MLAIIVSTGFTSPRQRLHHDKAMCYLRLKQYSEAEKALGRALAMYNNALSLRTLAAVRVQSGDAPGAVAAFEEALKCVFARNVCMWCVYVCVYVCVCGVCVFVLCAVCAFSLSPLYPLH